MVDRSVARLVHMLGAFHWLLKLGQLRCRDGPYDAISVVAERVKEDEQVWSNPATPNLLSFAAEDRSR